MIYRYNDSANLEKLLSLFYYFKAWPLLAAYQESPLLR